MMEEVMAERTRKRSRRAARGGSLVSRGERENGGEVGTAYQRTPAPPHTGPFTLGEWIPARCTPHLITVCLHDSASNE